MKKTMFTVLTCLALLFTACEDAVPDQTITPPGAIDLTGYWHLYSTVSGGSEEDNGGDYFIHTGNVLWSNSFNWVIDGDVILFSYDSGDVTITKTGTYDSNFMSGTGIRTDSNGSSTFTWRGTKTPIQYGAFSMSGPVDNSTPYNILVNANKGFAIKTNSSRTLINYEVYHIEDDVIIIFAIEADLVVGSNTISNAAATSVYVKTINDVYGEYFYDGTINMTSVSSSSITGTYDLVNYLTAQGSSSEPGVSGSFSVNIEDVLLIP